MILTVHPGPNKELANRRPFRCHAGRWEWDICGSQVLGVGVLSVVSHEIDPIKELLFVTGAVKKPCLNFKYFLL